MKISVVIFCTCLIYLCGSGDCLLQYTNIGKFIGKISEKVHNHSLDITNSKLDKHVLEQAFQGLRNVIDDPLVINEQTLNYEMKKVIKVRGHVRNLHIEHLKSMVLNHVFISDNNLYSGINVTVPLLEISGLYNASCYIDQYDFDVFGNGSFKWEITNFTFKVNFTLESMATGYMQLRRAYLDHSFNSSKFQIKNLLNDEEVSTVVSDVITIVINPLHSYFKPVINEFLNRIIALYSEVLFSNLKYTEFVGIIYAFKEKAISDNTVSPLFVDKI